MHRLATSILPSARRDISARRFRHSPAEERVGDTHGSPNAGIYKVGQSDLLQRSFLQENSWWKFLEKKKCTVATWSQGGQSTFDEAYATALRAWIRFEWETRQMKPPPSIALVGHSRGGLLIRRLLKELGAAGTARIQWAVSIHSPHHGSQLSRAPAELSAEVVDLMDSKLPAAMTAPLKKELKKLAVELARPLNQLLDDPSRELVPDGPLLRKLEEGEKPPPGVRWHTFGGINPTYVRLYTWVFDTQSAVPQTKVETRGVNTRVKTYFVWRARPVEIPLISPLFDQLRDFAPEIKPGHGDGVVADQRSRLAYAVHETTRLNHFEVLWNADLQARVLLLLSTSGPSLQGGPLPRPFPPGR